MRELITEAVEASPSPILATAGVGLAEVAAPRRSTKAARERYLRALRPRIVDMAHSRRGIARWASRARSPSSRLMNGASAPQARMRWRLGSRTSLVRRATVSATISAPSSSVGARNSSK